MTLNEFWQTVLPPLAAALAMIITALAWTAVAYLKSVRDKFSEGMDREALHSAVKTGVRAELELDPLAPDKEVVAAASRHVLNKGAPDAARNFGLTGSDLNRLVTSKVSEERSRIAAEKNPC